ncbi:hypothetical protein EVAR_55945_1 [Eumeta japonica]|uniref:Uncharacterized protein n=1 Tax=Eumeta variegata TaxID=151549 RepID=A0A4C1YRM8_EUMVA|nr:hypothetical protein EVAR_55945_1 [Eumeta japonica]
MRPTPLTRGLCCIPLEEAIITLGYFHASLAVMAILVVLRAVVSSISTSSHYGVKDLLVSLLPLGLSLTLAIFLIVGVKKRRPGYVTSYLIFSLPGVPVLAIFWQECKLQFTFYFFVNDIEKFLLFCVYAVCLGAVYAYHRSMKPEDDHDTPRGLLQEDASSGDKTNNREPEPGPKSRTVPEPELKARSALGLTVGRSIQKMNKHILCRRGRSRGRKLFEYTLGPFVLCEPAVSCKGLRHLGHHFHFLEDPVRLFHSGKEELGDFTRVSLGVSLLPLFQARRSDHRFCVRQRKLIIVHCHLFGEGGAPGELVCMLVFRYFGMRSNPE